MASTAILIASFWLAVAMVRQRTMHTGIDLGLYGQALNGYADGHRPWAALKAEGSFDLLGDHFSPIVAALAPFYLLWPNVVVLLIAQAAMIGLSMTIIGRAATRVLNDVPAALALTTAFGLSWGVSGLALFDFHEVAFALPLLAVSLERAIAQRWQAAVWWSLPLMLVKEDSAFLIFGLGMACWVAGQRRLALIAMASSVGAFLLVVSVVIPALSYSGSYTYWGSAGITGGPWASVLGLLVNLAHAFAGGSALATVGLALGCTLLLPLRSPLVLVIVPSLIARFTSPNEAYWGPHAHYNATLTVVMFLAALDGWQRSRRAGGSSRRCARRLAAIVVAVALVIAATSWARPLTHRAFYDCPRCGAARELLDRIPDGATVMADTYLASQLVDRTQVELTAENLVDSVGQPYLAEWIAMDVQDRGTFESIDRAYWWGANAAQNAGYVPVFASTDGYVLFHYDPPAATAFMHMYGAVACAASNAEAALCTTPPNDDTYRTRTAWCETVDPPHLPRPCPPSAYLKPYRQPTH